MHGTNAFFRDGERIFRTYFINDRGDEALGSTFSYLDMTALGRQEEWEDSPAGYPQTPRARGAASAGWIGTGAYTSGGNCTTSTEGAPWGRPAVSAPAGDDVRLDREHDPLVVGVVAQRVREVGDQGLSRRRLQRADRACERRGGSLAAQQLGR